jgi:pimeloyl-ACP methyl ester carboxylesterase
LTDTDDVRRLIEHLSDAPATIFGSSSGGIVALELLTHYPSVVGMLVPHEPPTVRLLADGQTWLDFFFSVYDRYRQSGIEPAIAMFRERAFAEYDQQFMGHDVDPANATYWFEHELRQYPAVDLDLDALRAHADRVVLMVGRESGGFPAYEVNVELGKRLVREMIEMPGGHIGFVTDPAAFSSKFLSALGWAGQGSQA